MAFEEVTESLQPGTESSIMMTDHYFATEVNDLGDGYMPMNEKQLSRIKTAFERNGGTIESSPELDRYLAIREAGAVTLNENTIILRHNPPPTATEVFEELIHTSQFRSGRVSTGNAIELEIEAKEKLLKYQKQYGIPDSEHESTKRQVENLQRALVESE